MRTDHRWRRLTAGGEVRTLTYSWGPATANALAIAIEGRGFLVLSAPRGAPASVHDELDAEGGVFALLAPNPYHWLGQAEWRRRFPQARSFAPRGALPRLAAKAPDLEFTPAEALVHELPSHVAIVVPEGQKVPDMLLRVTTERGEVVWWLGDLFSNTTRADARWFLRVLSRLAGSGPGYRRTSRPELVYVHDRARWLSSVREALLARPPTVVVPAHGAPVETDAAQRTFAVLDHGRDAHGADDSAPK